MAREQKPVTSSDAPDRFCRNIKLLAQKYKKFCTPPKNLKKKKKSRAHKAKQDQEEILHLLRIICGNFLLLKTSND